MPSALSAAPGVVAAGLSRLAPLPKNQYLTAWTPDGTCLYGDLKGYSAATLPNRIVQLLSSGDIKKVTHVSFGSDVSAWFLACENSKGQAEFHCGKAVAASLVKFFKTVCSFELRELPRVQFGAGGSYVAWTKSMWTAKNIPDSLLKFLNDISYTRDGYARVRFFHRGYPTTVTYHHDGTFFVIGRSQREANNSIASSNYYVWNYTADAIYNGWKALWRGREPYQAELAELAHVAINPHTPECDTFVFIKAQREESQADFVLRFGGEDHISKLSPVGKLLQPDLRGPRTTKSARCRRAGRPHPHDVWELSVKKDGIVKILEDKGRGWYVAENARGAQGFVHRDCLDFKHRIRIEPEVLYTEYQKEVAELFREGAIAAFPVLPEYVDVCVDEGCSSIKADSSGLGICMHDLEKLLRASGCYSRAFLKGERNKWHPDQFARFCHADHREELTKKSEQLFIMMGLLMDILEDPTKGKGVH